MIERYDEIGLGYAKSRQSDERIYAQLRRALGPAASVLNVGAGTGSYEPADVPVTAVEPSLEMIGQRRDRSNVVRGRAEALPFRDGSFDASLAILTMHHWSNRGRGMEECARLARQRVVVLTWDPDAPGFWLTADYFPDLLELDRGIFPPLDEFRRHFDEVEIESVLVPADCSDGFLGAYWRRPEAYLDPAVRCGMSTFSRIEKVEERIAALREDLRSGAWHRAHSDLLGADSLDLGYRLVVAELG